MKYVADLHIHSKYSRACSKDCDLEHLAWWAGRKGIAVVGTGDFTHPAWAEELRTKLVPAEPGLYRLAPELERDVLERLPPACRTPVRFLLSSEISTIYKRDERTRKVHHLLYAPDLDAVADITRQLDRIGNLASDGRPILGLDSRDLLDITLSAGDDCYLVPAHIWTPWFAALGSQSGFDAVDACYADLAGHVFAVETGLSSDPEMNWRVSHLDRYRLVSNSDAHSPPMLGREATRFATGLDYFSLRRALETGEGFAGTVEFFPEEGKYHLDGHRACDVRLSPPETRAVDGRCPACGKPLTVGVLHRVDRLADRPVGHRPPGADAFASLVPLPEIVGEITGVGPKSKSVAARVAGLVDRLGPELAILSEVPLDDIGAAGGSSLLVEALARLRRGQVHREAGYDGVYGTIRLFAPDELARHGASTLFELSAPEPASPEPAGPEAPTPAEAPVPREAVAEAAEVAPPAAGDGLDDDQRAVVEGPGGPLLVVAGPGAGKTRVLTRLLAHRISGGVAVPERCLAVTFTRRAAAELRERLAALLPDGGERVLVTTFHGLGWLLVREHHVRLGLPEELRVADDAARLALVEELWPGSRTAVKRRADALSEAKRVPEGLAADTDETDETVATRHRYDRELHARGLVDLDDLLALPVALLSADAELAETARDRWSQVAVDEYQDLDELQYRLLRLLTRPDGDLTVIGDPDQAIYAFRGGDVGFFLRFTEDFPAARVAHLTRNYRSAPVIVHAALDAIAPATLVPGRELVPTRAGRADERVEVHHAGSEAAEAEVVADTIETLLGGSSLHALDRRVLAGPDAADPTRHQLCFADFAVLYRTAAQAGPILDALHRRGFPAQARSHERLADRDDVRALLAALPGTDADLSLLRRLVALVEAEGSGALAPAAELLGPLAQECGTDLSRFSAELALGVEVDSWDPRADRVSLLTLHAAKGLEFPIVFVVGCEDGLLPYRRFPRPTPDAGGRPEPSEHSDDPDEERRLLFVGMTRATTRLILTRAGRRVRWGTVRDTQPSPLLADISPEHLEIHEVAPGRARPGAAAHHQLRLL